MRLFLAVHLSEEIKTEIEKTLQFLKTLKADVKWIEPQALHITLKFLGDTDKSRVKGIIPMLEEIAAGSEPFSFTTGRLGAFPDLKTPKIIFEDLSAGKNELIALSKIIDETLVKAAFKREEKPFNPHITLGRYKGVENPEKLSEALINHNSAQIKQHVNTYFLMKSELVGNTPVYKDIAEFRLKAKNSL